MRRGSAALCRHNSSDGVSLVPPVSAAQPTRHPRTHCTSTGEGSSRVTAIATGQVAVSDQSSFKCKGGGGKDRQEREQGRTMRGDTPALRRATRYRLQLRCAALRAHLALLPLLLACTPLPPNLFPRSSHPAHSPALLLLASSRRTKLCDCTWRAPLTARSNICSSG